MTDPSWGFHSAARRFGRAVTATVLAHPVLRLTLGRWPEPDEVRLFQLGFAETHSRIPPLLRSLASVPAARPYLTRTMLRAWMETSPHYRALLPAGADPPGTALMGDPLRVWTGPPIAFLHLEKTAGSSLIDVLQAQFHPLQIDPDPQRTFPPHMLSPFAHGTDAIRRYPLIWGHYDLPALRRLGAERLVVMLLREPRQRILSLYDFWRATQLPDTPAAQENIGPATAQRRSLLDFLRSPEALIRDYIDNCYVRRLAGRYSTGAGHDPLAADATGSLAVALDSLDRLAFVGITERMEETVAALGQVLGFEAPRTAPRINVGRVTGGRKPSHDQREPLTPELEAELDRLTALDRVVYDRATQRFDALRGRLVPAAGAAGLTHR